MPQKTPQIPSVHSLDVDIKKVVKPIKEIIETREGLIGSSKDRFVTFQSLVDLGLITEDQIPR